QERIVHVCATPLAPGCVHERAHSALAAIGKWQLDQGRLRPYLTDATRDRGRDGDRIGAAFERLRSDDDPSRRALRHSGNVMERTECSPDGAPKLGLQVTLSTSPDAGCTTRVPSEIAPA